jgi:hypothetical protein
MSNIKVNVISDLTESVAINTTSLVAKDSSGYAYTATPPSGDSSTKVATTAFVIAAVGTGGSGGGAATSIGGYPIIITSAQENDVLQLISGVWRNVPQTNLTDGGSF